MDLIEKLEKLKTYQKNIAEEYEKLLNDAKSISQLNKNETLSKEYGKIKNEAIELKLKVEKLEIENKNLKITLKEQILDEKLNILKISKKKIDLYFQKQENETINDLAKFESEFKSKIDNLINTVNKNIILDKNYFWNEINQLNIKILEKIKEEQKQLKEKELNTTNEINDKFRSLSNENLTEEQIKKRVKQNKFEMKIGLNWLNKAGFILILIGLGVLAKFTYAYINDYVKGIFFFVLGIISIITGEFFYRKQKDVFATGLLGGGIAILYASVFYSYFLLKIIDMNAGLVLSIIVTFATIILSIRYNSKTVISFGLIGGYLPFLTFVFVYGLEFEKIYIAMGYLFLLNILILSISFWKKWNVSNYISFILNIPSLIYLVFKCPEPVIGIIYSAVTFLMYLLLVVSYPIMKKATLGILDVLLLALNTIISSVIIYILFDDAKLSSFNGLLALGFCVLYVVLGFLINKFDSKEKKSMILFFITALTFAVLIIPFQFKIEWLSMGWMVEGSLLIIFGYKKKIKYLELAGWLITALFAVFFYFYEFLGKIVLDNEVVYFNLKYLAVTISSILIFVIYQIDYTKKIFSEFSTKGKLTKLLKYFVVINFYVFLLYFGITYYNMFIQNISTNQDIIIKFYKWIMISVITMGLGFSLNKIKPIYDKVLSVFSIVLNIISIIIFLNVLTFIPLFSSKIDQGDFFRYFSLGILIIFNILVLFNLGDLIKRFIKYTNKNAELIPLFIGIFLLGNITDFLVRQFNFSNINLIVSFTYLFIAISCILYGFNKRYLYIRIYGLVLTVLTLGKFFIYDLRFLDTVGKICAYLGFGLLLVFISFIYQRINSKLEIKDKKNEEEN